jgi:uroporphyrinogen-III decarboxylase
MARSKQELLKERESRIEDVIRLKRPDRVPIWFHSTNFFAARRAGFSFKDVMYDGEKLQAAQKAMILEFEPDAYYVGGIPVPGGVVEELDCRTIKWPGHGLEDNQPFQYVEGEYMKADEYDIFLDDPSDWVLRTYLPRVFGKLDVFGNFPPLTGLLQGYYGLPSISAFALKPFLDAFNVICKAANDQLVFQNMEAKSREELAKAGYPCAMAGITLSPFDAVSDTLRGMRGTMLDIYRRPEKLVKAVEKLLPLTISNGIVSARINNSSRVFIPLHRGADAFMSSKQFEVFYWPTLKAMLMALIDAGLTPCPFFEGDYTNRLDFLAQLPPAKVVGLFDRTDIHKAKEKLGNVMCIAGLMPSSLLQTGTSDLVISRAKELIDVVGRDGGFIMGLNSTMDDVRPDLLKLWVDFTKEYGMYK